MEPTYKQAELDDGRKEVFVWKKKLEQQKASGTLSKEWKKDLKRKRKELQSEIMEVKARKLKREQEKERRQKEREEEKRLEEQEAAEEWEKKGEEFAVVQLKIRRDQRLVDGRAKAIDLLSKNLDYLEADDEALRKIKYTPELRAPEKIITDKSVTLSDLNELRNDVDSFLRYFKDSVWWNAVGTLVDDAILNYGKSGPRTAEEGGIHTSVASEVEEGLKNKSLTELEQMEKDMTKTVRTGGSGIDIEFWSTLLKRLAVFKAAAYLREQHQQMLQKHLKTLKQKKEEMGDEPEVAPQQQQRRRQLNEEDLEDIEEASDSEAGGLSPVLEHGVAGQDGGDTVEDNARRLKRKFELAQKKQAEQAAVKQAASSLGVSTDLGDDEHVLTDEVNLSVEKKSWHDKWRPRRPKYFNRVHTGYEWNKYNSTHYDYDNPPPKVVMGYKFNIFYPDLVDQYQQPTYYVEPTEKGWDDDVCLIRFHAGPPYEDIAFKIVNREWEYGHRRGFRCTFERGVLHLYFNFVRYRYRR